MVNMIPWTNRRRDYGETGGALFTLRNEMERLFDRFFDVPGNGSESMSPTSTWAPLMEIYEQGNDLVVCAEVPGIDPGNIDISVSGNQLTISGEKRESHENQQGGFYRTERRFGSFRRTIELPPEVDAEKVSAEYDNGVLKLHIPISEAQQPKRIPVNVASGKSGQTRQPMQNQQGQKDKQGQQHKSSQSKSQ